MRIRDRLGAGPLDLIRRVVHKTIIGPIKYRSERGYDARRFWEDRFRRYGTSLRGGGDEGLSEEDNRRVYEEAAGVILDRIRESGVDLGSARVLDVGCGPGYFTDVLVREGVRSYTGLDITDELFPMLRRRFPDYRFVRADISQDAVEGEYELVIVIDVAEHIVHDEAIDQALATIREVVAPGGVCLIGPLMDQPERHLFYVRFWSLEEVAARMQGLEALAPVAFRHGKLAGFRRPG